MAYSIWEQKVAEPAARAASTRAETGDGTEDSETGDGDVGRERVPRHAAACHDVSAKRSLTCGVT